MMRYFAFSKKSLQIVRFLLAFISGWCCFAGVAQADLNSGGSIICGLATNGDPIYCPRETSYCYLCEEEIRYYIFNIKEHKTEYRCLSKTVPVPKNCTRADSGGKTGEGYTSIFGFLELSSSRDKGQMCVVDNFKTIYFSTCYSCEIVSVLISAFIRAGAKAYEVSRQAGNAILVVALILWIGFFVLKNISSFTTVEPMKMLQDLLVQLFKVFLAFVILNSGIQTILHYTLEPIVMAGTDFGSVILSSTTGVNAEATNKNAQGTLNTGGSQ